MPKNYKNTQEYLNSLYSNKLEIKVINLENQELEGSLDLKYFPNLELLTIKNNQISEVDVSNCKKLKHLDLTQNNNLTKLTVYELNFFERLVADTGTLKKSSIFGGKSEWEPTNIGNSNIPPLKITETKPKSQKKPDESGENINNQPYSSENKNWLEKSIGSAWTWLIIVGLLIILILWWVKKKMF